MAPWRRDGEQTRLPADTEDHKHNWIHLMPAKVDEIRFFFARFDF